VVQVGAFAESRTVVDVRAKVERLGLKTYTQVVTVQAGERTRVRVGPFADRDEAEAAAARLKKAGLPAAVLTL
jgi:DedD protein